MLSLTIHCRYFLYLPVADMRKGLCAMNIVSKLRQWRYIKDEGRPLGVDWQKLIPNRFMRHKLRAIVVSNTLKVCNKTGR